MCRAVLVNAEWKGVRFSKLVNGGQAWRERLVKSARNGLGSQFHTTGWHRLLYLSIGIFYSEGTISRNGVYRFEKPAERSG